MTLLDLHGSICKYLNSYDTQNDCFSPQSIFGFFFQQRVVVKQIIMITNYNFTRNDMENECLTFYKIILCTAVNAHTVYGVCHHHDIILQVWAPSYTYHDIMLYYTNGQRLL